MLILDTSAWIEFFIKSSKGEIVEKYLQQENCYTSIVSIAEISNWSSKQNLDSKVFIEYITELSQIVGMTLKIAASAGELNYQRKKIEKDWGMIDSIILATAQAFDLKILTKDSQFKDLKNIELLKD